MNRLSWIWAVVAFLMFALPLTAVVFAERRMKAESVTDKVEKTSVVAEVTGEK